MELYELRQRQSLPLEAKITMSQQRIREWHEHWDGQVYVSFSGGKDSSVLLHLVRSLYPEVPAAFVDRAGIPCDSQFRPFCGERHLAAPGEALSGNRAGIRLSRGQQGYREKRILRAEGQQLGIAPVSGTESGRHAVPMVRFPAEKVEKAAGRTVQNQ